MMWYLLGRIGRTRQHRVRGRKVGVIRPLQHAIDQSVIHGNLTFSEESELDYAVGFPDSVV